MTSSPLTPAEQDALLEAEGRADPFVMYRDGHGDLRFTHLGGGGRLVIGRDAGNDIVLDWDAQVSRSHAQLELVGLGWTLVDDGLSRNGSQVNGERIAGRRRLGDGDVLRIGETTIVFRAPPVGSESTVTERAAPPAVLTEAERRVLVALCAPMVLRPGPGSAPATNRDLAAALHLSVYGVKSHVRSLFTKLGVADLPQYQKRTELARIALDRGLVTRSDVID